MRLHRHNSHSPSSGSGVPSDQRFQLRALLHQAPDAVLEDLGFGFEVVAEVGAPEGVFVEGGAEGGEPEIEGWEAEVGSWGCGGLAEGGGEAAGDEDDADGGFGFEDFAYDAGWVAND